MCPTAGARTVPRSMTGRVLFSGALSEAGRNADLSGVPISEVSDLERMRSPGLALLPSFLFVAGVQRPPRREYWAAGSMPAIPVLGET